IELQALTRSLVRELERRDLACLVFDDRGAEQLLVDPVEASADPVVAERKSEILLDVGRPDAVGLLLLPEARQRLAARGLACLLVLPREEALVHPLLLVLGEEIIERRVVAGRATAQ